MIWLVSLIMAIYSLDGKENVTLEQLRWKNRIVLYLPRPGQNPEFEIESLKDKLYERKIIFLSIGKAFYSNSELNFSNDYLESLQKKYFGGKNQEKWILIGLDGGIKLNRQGEPDWDFIFKTIDAMPMRQSELRKDL
jgi:hypothetical protein